MQMSSGTANSILLETRFKLSFASYLAESNFIQEARRQLLFQVFATKVRSMATALAIFPLDGSLNISARHR